MKGTSHANKYLGQGSERSKKVKELFNQIADKYDLLNDLLSFGLHRRWKYTTAELAVWQEGIKVLDACCGSGDLAIMIALRGANTVGVDFCEKMLQIALSRVESIEKKFGSLNINFIQADVMNLPFQNGEFDAVTIAYGLRNLPDPYMGLRELSRILKKGGRLLILDFALPQSRLWRFFYRTYLVWWAPFMARILGAEKDAYAYIWPSLLLYPPVEQISKWLTHMGACKILVKKWIGGGMSLHIAQF